MSPFDKWRNQISLCIHYSKIEPRPLETSLTRVTLRMHSLFQRKLRTHENMKLTVGVERGHQRADTLKP